MNKGVMSQRILRINDLIRDELAKIFSKELDLEPGVLVTVTRVVCNNNLQEAKVYISAWPVDQRKKVVKSLKRHIFAIQKKIDKMLKMRPVPRLVFVEEKELEKAGRIEELLDKI